MNDVFDGYKYDKETESSPLLSKKKYLIDYAKFVAREGAKSNINNINVIDMDSLKDSLGYTPTPKSMDLVLIASKSKVYGKNTKMDFKYILADFKFNITSLDKVDKNISNDDIKGKFNFTVEYIHSVDSEKQVFDTAFFIFKDNNFEQIKNRWQRRHLNNPKNLALKKSDFEIIFQ